MSNISPDGAWRWNGSEWTPNVGAPPPPPPAAAQTHKYASQASSGWDTNQGYGAPDPHIAPDAAWPGQYAQNDWYASPPPRPMTPVEERNVAAWSHYGPLIVCGVATLMVLSIVGAGLAIFGIFAFVIPLVIRQTQGQRSRFVNAHATESLNFQLTWLMIGTVAALLSVIPAMITLGLFYLLFIPVWIGFAIFMIVVMVKGGTSAKAGVLYRYPLTIRFVQSA